MPYRQVRLHIADLMRADLITPALEASDKEAFFRKMTLPLVAAGILNEQQYERLFAAIKTREDYESTAIGRGLALPHAYLADLPDNFILVGRSTKAVDFGAPGFGAVRLVFLLVGPKRDNMEHLMMLARLARLLKDESFVEALMSAPDAEAMLQAVRDVEARHC